MSVFDSLFRTLGFIDDEAGSREDEDSEAVEYEDSEEEEEERPRRSGNFFNGILSRFSNRSSSDSDEDDEEEDEDEVEEAVAPPPRASRTPKGNTNSNVIDISGKMAPKSRHCEHIVVVHQIEECREIIRYLLDGESVLLNLENVDPKDCGRVVDLLSGAAFALSGRMVKVAHLCYLLAPENVELIEPSTRTGASRYTR